MNILFLAPHPFYQNRGTPIAVNLLLKFLSDREYLVDVVAYSEGYNVKYNNIAIHRIIKIPWIKEIRPGFSWKKIICDILMIFKILNLILRNKYHLIHAVEESVFIALLLKKILNIPYIYDMDSSLSQQLIDKKPLLASFKSLFQFLEGCAVRNARVVAPVCEALAVGIQKYHPEKVVVLQDVSLLEQTECSEEALRAKLDIQGCLLMYVGNLETYQGIDLLLESFALVVKTGPLASLVIIGGEPADVQKYRKKAGALAIDHRVHFLGPKPVEYLGAYLSQADILVSPRLQGENTPMKLYSYLHSGKALLATNLPTHTQILNSRVAMLTDATPEAFAKGMVYLMSDENLRLELGQAGKRLVEDQYSYAIFCDKLHDLFDALEVELGVVSHTVQSRTDHPPQVLR
jgi:glycosyltransferase involved in cell wall biosynthesis